MSTASTPNKTPLTTAELSTMPENHLDTVATPGSIDPSRQATLRTRLIAVIAMPLFFLITFTLCFVSATHAPTPHDLALTVAGPSAVTEQLAAAIEDQAEGAFDITQTTDATAAHDAVATRDAVGAIIVDGTNVTTIVASGGGRLAASTVQTVGDRIAAQLGGTNTITDVAPLPADDPTGTVLFFLLVICTVGAFLSITVISQIIPGAGARELTVTAIGAAILVPIIGFTVISFFVDYGATFGTIAALLGVGMIYAFTVGMIATLFTLLLGQAAVFAEILILVAFSFTSAGNSAPESMLPPFWQGIHNGWLGSGAFESMRSILFFGGNGLGRWLLLLLIWTAAAVLLTAIVGIRTKRIAQKAARRESEAAQPAEVVPATASAVTAPAVTASAVTASAATATAAAAPAATEPAAAGGVR
ncbi:hypothetical protein HQQ81_12190 [Microbacteriaceae bacterium VKM Ac-2854]|nr:hypothetical protein [Microbacteriaceae bacterium VKM Ac-2854]